ncbi:hypothetical protein [Halobellus marinus]|uniref:hypothetical protein n=1 Tax=Halobellus TaxID=1073986 RepID=UPI0028B15382|nr:hypothetical protein [Halobellus sp. DFY28]
MSSEDPCSDELSAIVAAFNQRGTVEPGLNVEGDALLQLRKACRILDGIRALRDIDRYHTLVVEGSFAALERTVQFYVVERGLAESNELLSHEDTFDYGAQAGIFSRSTKGELIELWKNHRNSTYYQQERATAEQATTMLAYAECMHKHIPKLAGRAHDCIC